MSRPARFALLFIALALGPTAGGAAPAAAQAGHAGHGAPPAAAEGELDLEGVTVESLRQAGRMVEVAPGAVQISPERRQLIGVKTGPVEMRRLRKTIRANGRVDFDEKRLATVSSKVGGWVEELWVDYTGAYVKKGAPLLALYSPELVATQEEYLAARRASGELAASPYPEVAAGGRAIAEAARRRLQLWDVSAEEIREIERTGAARKTLTLHSPYAGFVLERMVTRGMRIDPGMSLYRLADLSVVWVLADVYESDLPHMRRGQAAAVRATALPGRTLPARVVYIYPTLDPQTRAVRVRLELANPDGRLKPEMFAQVEIAVDLGERLAVPESAVIDTGVRRVAILERVEGVFEPREIETGVRAEGWVEVVKGLAAGERLVTSANFLIDSESRLREAVGGMAGHQH